MGRFAAVGSIGKAFSQGMKNRGFLRAVGGEADEMIRLRKAAKLSEVVNDPSLTNSKRVAEVANVHQSFNEHAPDFKKVYTDVRKMNGSGSYTELVDPNLMGKMAYSAGDTASRIGGAAKSLAPHALMLAPEMVLYSAMMMPKNPSTGQDVMYNQPGMSEQEMYLTQMQNQTGGMSYPQYQSY